MRFSCCPEHGSERIEDLTIHRREFLVIHAEQSIRCRYHLRPSCLVEMFACCFRSWIYPKSYCVCYSLTLSFCYDHSLMPPCHYDLCHDEQQHLFPHQQPSFTVYSVPFTWPFSPQPPSLDRPKVDSCQSEL